MAALVAARFLPHGFARLRCGDCGHEQLSFVQRFGGLVNLNVHFHVVVPDGVFVKEDVGPVHFVEVGSPEDEDVLAVLKKVVRRVLRRLETLAVQSGITGHVVAAALGHESFSTTVQSYAKPEAVASAKQQTVLKVLTGGRP